MLLIVKLRYAAASIEQWHGDSFHSKSCFPGCTPGLLGWSVVVGFHPNPIDNLLGSGFSLKNCDSYLGE
jgi:hypothetical protein